MPNRRKRPRLRDFPGMVNVCLFHVGRAIHDGDMAWRDGGTPNCVCERQQDALIRLRAEAAWARQDEAEARKRAEELEAQLEEVSR